MHASLLLLLQGGAVPTSPLDLIRIAGPETKAVLVVTAVFSLISWFIIVYKLWHFRSLNRQARRFFDQMERSGTLREAFRNVGRLPASAYTRLFNEGMTFYSELKPGALQGEAAPGTRQGLLPTHLEALKMVLGKEIAEERDALLHYVPWLATIGSVSPLLGLLGTVLGIMNAFVGIASRGSGNLSAVAPGVAEALVATAAGLAAAIPAVIAYNLFVNRVRLLTGELEGFANELIGSMAREGLI